MKENATPRTTRVRAGREATEEGEAKSYGDKTMTTQSADSEGTAGDMPGYQTTLEDLRLQEFYREWVHANTGAHLDSGVRDNVAWQAWWHERAVMSLRRYDAPSRKVRR